MINKSDSSEVLKTAYVLKDFNKILEADLERELLRAAADVVVIVVDRVRRQGESANGQILQTKSPKTLGRYSKYHGQKRKDAGLQTGRVDLSFTGQMLSDWNVTEQIPRQVGVGFVTEESHEIANGLEEYCGDEIFLPSDSEEQEVMEDAMSRIERLIETV